MSTYYNLGIYACKQSGGSYENMPANFIWFIICATDGAQYVVMTWGSGQFRRCRTQAYSNVFKT